MDRARARQPNSDQQPAVEQPAARERVDSPAATAGLIHTSSPPLRLPSVDASGSGDRLPATVQRPIETSLGVNLSAVRLHTGSRAADANRALTARAFTYGPNIVLGAGARPSDLGLIAHEAAHVVQQGAAPPRARATSDTAEVRPTVQRSSASTSDVFEVEAQRAAQAVVRGEAFTVQERTTNPQPQRLGVSDALDYFADKANIIPGFRMFTIILGVNPINMRRIERSAANILRALVEFIPGGGLIVQALDNYGIFDRIGGWVDEQIRTLGMTGSVIRQAVMDFIDSLSWSDIFDLGGVWERAKRIFTAPIDRIINFAKGLVTGIIRFIKDAIVRPLAKLAEGTQGYDLLKAVLGYDPITGDPVPRNAETLIGGFMKLIGQEEVWNNLKRANAVGKAWSWFQGALSGVVGFVRQIPRLFISTLQQLELADIVLLPRAFGKVVRVFGSFFGQFFAWAGQQVLNLLQIIFEVLAPAAMPYIRRALGAFRLIVRDPIRFIGLLVRAGIQGFRQFAANFLTHLRTSLINWLTGSLSGASIYIPQSFTLREMIKFVLSVLGLTWQNIRQKLVRAIGETAVKALETGFDIVVTLVTQGPAAAWEKIQEAISNLRDMVMEQIMTFVRERIVQAAITRLLTSLNPAGAFIQAVIAIYNTIMFFVERLRQIAQVAMSFIDSISAIASGNIGAAASRVERTMAGLLTLVISFLARLVGLGRVSDAVVGIVNRIRAPIDHALDRVVNWIVNLARRAGRFIAQAGLPQDPNERLGLGLDAATAAVNALRQSSVTATVINPVLAAIKLRYGFRTLQPVQSGNEWWVEGEINPRARKKTNKVASAPAQPAAAPAGAVVWPVSIGNNITLEGQRTHRIETVQAIDPQNNTITFSISARGIPGSSTRPHAWFMQEWNAGRIKRSGQMSAAQWRAEFTRLYGADVADAIMRRDELADNFPQLANVEQAHHIIPVGALKAQGMMHLLVKSGWNFNQKMNGIPLANNFHGNHPNYNNYVNRKIAVWVKANGTNNTAAFKGYVENELMPFLTNHILIAKNQYAATGKTLNDYFATVP